MDAFKKNDLQRLAETQADPALSILLPTHRAGAQVRQNAIRFKNLLKQARRQLTDYGLSAPRIDELLQEPQRLQADDDWWQHQSDGLALFLTAEQFSLYRVPVAFDETVVVGPRFYVRPMVELVEENAPFYILAASQKRLRLLKAWRYGAEDLQLDALPKDLRTALNIDEYTSALQQHSTAGPQQAGGMMFHGQGGAGMEVRKSDEIVQYFRRVNAALAPFLAEKQAPLLFAGVDYLFPLFRESCRYANLVETPLEGNPDDMSAAQLGEKAWPALEPIVAKSREQAVADVQNHGGDRQATDLNVVIRAARQGAVDTLLLDRDQQRWGLIEEQQGGVALKESNGSPRQELLNDAAVHTLSTGGRVFSLPHDRFPDESPAAALLRFPISQTSAL